jgi:hypothetical protein
VSSPKRDGGVSWDDALSLGVLMRIVASDPEFGLMRELSLKIRAIQHEMSQVGNRVEQRLFDWLMADATEAADDSSGTHHLTREQSEAFLKRFGL